jgi:hypothetical protein
LTALTTTGRVSLALAGWLAVAFGLASATRADEPVAVPTPPPTAETQPEPAVTDEEWDYPIYVQPGLDRPADRASGGVRGPKRHELILVAPRDHVGHSATPQPTLFWYIAEATPLPVELVIQEERAVKPLVVRTLPAPSEPGYRAISLREIGVKLREGVVYEWWIALVTDDARRSRDAAVGRALVVYEPSRFTTLRLTKVRRSQRAVVFADAGYWYDAIEATVRGIELYPHLEGPRRQRQALGSQVGLELPLR